MSTYPPSGDCVHCGQYFRALTWDHVFPKAWYPETTPLNIEKWQIPSCKQCNADYGRLEEELLIKLGLCVDPADYASFGITGKVLRALNPQYAKSSKDRRIRKAKRDKILREALYGSQIPPEGLFPNFDKPTGLLNDPPMGVKISADHIKKLTIKLVRGITYLEDAYIIRDPYRISTFVLQDRDADPIVSLLTKLGKVYAREPGIVVVRGTAFDDRKTAIYSIAIWGRFKLYAHVGDQDVNTSL